MSGWCCLLSLRMDTLRFRELLNQHVNAYLGVGEIKLMICGKVSLLNGGNDEFCEALQLFCVLCIFEILYCMR